MTFVKPNPSLKDSHKKRKISSVRQNGSGQKPWPFVYQGRLTSMTGVTEEGASRTKTKKQATVGDVNENIIAGHIQDSVDDDERDNSRLNDPFGDTNSPRSSPVIRTNVVEEQVPGASFSVGKTNSDQKSSTSAMAKSIQLAKKGNSRFSNFMGSGPTMFKGVKRYPRGGKSISSSYPQKIYTLAMIPLFASALADRLSETLPKELRLPHYQVSERRTVLNDVEHLLETYCNQISRRNVENSLPRQASKAIRRLKFEISRNVLSAWNEDNELERTVKQNISIPCLIDGDENSSDISRSNEKEDELSHPFEAWQGPKPDDAKDFSAGSADDQGICDYLIGHRAFSTLQTDLHATFVRHFGDQTKLISLRITRTLRLPHILRKTISGRFTATFATAWNPVRFLEDQYPKGRLQPLRDVLAITGNSVNAQMCTVDQYLRQNWTKYTFELIDYLTNVISASANGIIIPETTYFTGKRSIAYSTETRTFRVRGPEDFIVTIGQQLAWLGAACRNSNGRLAFCYTTFTVSNSESLCPIFSLSHEASSSGIGHSNSCWNDLVGGSVIVYGFPIPKRNDEVHGLHLPVELMAVLGRIPFATYFDGGYVLKGRSFVIVPLQRRGASVQWHLFQNKDGGRIEYEDLSELAPDRLLVKESDGTAFLSAGSYLGWCPQCNVNLATENYDYLGIKYTKSESKQKLTISADSFMIGFQQWGAAGVNFTLGRHQGFYRNEIAEFYRDLLNDSSNLHVVLQDMEARRAWHTDAETMILHIILHRYELGAFNVSDSPMHLERAKFDNPNSVREAMLSNRDISIEIDKHLKEAGVNNKQFSHIVNELFQVFDGLQASQRQITRKGGFELNGLRGRDVCGWEYLDLVNRAHHPEYRRTHLEETCGQWPELMRQLNAVVLYGSFFQDVFEPSTPAQTCLKLKHLPPGKDYLAMQVPSLNRLYYESGTLSKDDEMARITSKGTRLCPSKYLFDPCPCNTVRNSSASNGNCLCDRIQYLDFKSNKKIKKLAGLGETGAIIVGKRSSTSKIWDINKPKAKPKDTSDSHRQGMSNAFSRMNQPRALGMTAVSLPSIAVTSSPPQPAPPLSRALTISQAPIQQTSLLCQQSPPSQQVT